MSADQKSDTAFPPKQKYEPLPGRGLLAAAGFDLKLARRAAPEALADRPPLLAGLTRLAAGENYFLAGPVLGAPMAVMALEELIRRGAEEVVFVGLAGALVNESQPGSGPDWSAGDLLLPVSGLSTEGTSAHYAPKGALHRLKVSSPEIAVREQASALTHFPATLQPDPNLTARIRRANSGPLAEESIWSTDAIYRETAELTAAQWAQGARAVDMECTALWAAAAFRGLRLAALLVISDLLKLRNDPEPTLEHKTGFHQPAFKQGLARAAETAWRALRPEWSPTPSKGLIAETGRPGIG